LAARHLEAPVPEPKPFNIPLPSGGGARNALPLYDFPAQTVRENFIAEMPIRVSALRSLGAFTNVFAIESFVDELAQLAGVDPVEFRLRHLKDARARAVLERLAELAPADSDPTGDVASGVGYAFAQYKNRSAYCAVAVHATVERSTGRVSIPRAFAVADAGLIVNPDGAKNQIEGGVVQATSWTLHEQVTTDPSGVTSRDWSSYPILRFSEAPRIEVELIERPNERSLGLGEASQGPTGAAICNAVCNAAGVRLRTLPLTAERMASALRSETG
jgi:CO/xanthine dehydrogenase Mo-binding subunit